MSAFQYMKSEVGTMLEYWEPASTPSFDITESGYIGLKDAETQIFLTLVLKQTYTVYVVSARSHTFGEVWPAWLALRSIAGAAH